MPSIPGVAASQARIYVDEFELTQQSSGAELNATMQEISYPIMGDSSTHQQITTPSFNIPHRGYYTGRGATNDLGYFEDTIRSRLGTTDDVVVSLILGPVTYTLFGTWNTQMTIDAPVAELITIEANWASPESVRRGLTIPANTFADSDVTPSIDLGAAGVANAFVVHAYGFDDLTAGAETVTVNVQTSTTQGGTYTTWLSAVLKKPGAVLVSGANNPNRWVRVQVDFTAGVPGPVTAAESVLFI